MNLQHLYVNELENKREVVKMKPHSIYIHIRFTLVLQIDSLIKMLILNLFCRQKQSAFIISDWKHFCIIHKYIVNLFVDMITTTYLDVLWCQPFKLIQVVSTSEFHEYCWNDIDFIFFHPLYFLQGLRSLKH